jgi:arginase
MDYGQSRRGVDMGPSAVRYAGLQNRLRGLGYTVHDCGNVQVDVVEEVAETESRSDGNARHLGAVVQVCQTIYDTAQAEIAPDEFAIFLGGDHSIAVGSVASAAKAHGKIGVLWVDAHGDYNTPETSPSGNVHGMPMAALLGKGASALIDVGYAGAKLSPEQVVMIGIRDLDGLERTHLSSSGITVYTMAAIDEHGIGVITRRVIDYLSQFSAIHVSLDMDSLDPTHAPGVGTPVRGGLSYREAHLIMELLAASGKVRSLDIVEINPILDEHNSTAELSVELAASLLGKRIM